MTRPYFDWKSDDGTVTFASFKDGSTKKEFSLKSSTTGTEEE
jgi:hypothetical protein